MAHIDRKNKEIDDIVMAQNKIGDIYELIMLIPGSKEEKMSSIIKT